jgi:hypothetical protein
MRERVAAATAAPCEATHLSNADEYASAELFDPERRKQRCSL